MCLKLSRENLTRIFEKIILGQKINAENDEFQKENRTLKIRIKFSASILKRTKHKINGWQN